MASNILIIESDKLLAQNLAGLLSNVGLEAQWTADAQTAINLADATTPNAVIIDLLLAGRSGVEFLYEFRSYPDWRQIPIIIYSSVSEAEVSATRECFKQLDIKRFFYKPTTKLADLVDEVSWLALAHSAA